MTLENFNYRTDSLFLKNEFASANSFGIPDIPKAKFTENELKNILLLGFNQIKKDNGSHSDRIIHFFLYDYNFEKIWSNPKMYLNTLSKYKGILTPDFSMYIEMPYTIQLYNTFRNRWCGAYFASKGVKVIPTVSWGDEKSYDFCFKGIEKGSIVAVSTYMFHETDHHKEQKELFMRGYNKMLSEIEPEKIICYSEPFSEMTGDIIYVDYELSSWKYLYKKTTNPLTPNKKCNIITKYYGYVCKGGGSAYGGEWKPKSNADERLIGTPGEIKTNYDKGYKIDVKIGENGFAIKERHYTDHSMPKYHTNPHDHDITWENNHPNFHREINYYDSNIPEFKYYETEHKVNKEVIYNMDLELSFKTIAELKMCILYGDEITFSYHNCLYGIGRATENLFYICRCNTCDESLESENVEDILNYTFDDNKKLRECLDEIKIIDRVF